MIKHSLELIKKVDEARIDFWLTDFNKNQKQVVLPEENEKIDTGEHTLEDLRDQGDDTKDKDEEDDWEIVR